MKKQKLFAIIVLMTMILLFCSGCAVMPVPEVKEGRFEFSVTYVVDGVEKTYDGVYICEYAGIYVTLVGESRIWNGYIENGDGNTVIAVKNIDDLVIYINFGLYPDYFMADPDCYGEKPRPTVFGEIIDKETGGISFFGDETEIYENYGVKIINFEYADPITNSYKDKLSFGVFVPEIN